MVRRSATYAARPCPTPRQGLGPDRDLEVAGARAVVSAVPGVLVAFAYHLQHLGAKVAISCSSVSSFTVMSAMTRSIC